MFSKDIKILVVDDMRTMRRIVFKCLTDLGYTNLYEADDGATAWEVIQKSIAEKKPFQLIISDWNMPEMKGIELLERVRKTSEMKTTPFMLVTAETEMSQVVQAVQLGVNDYLTKPFTPQTFKEKLEKISGSNRAA